MIKMSCAALAAAASVCLFAAPASASVLSVTGSLDASDPTFSRPGFGSPPSDVWGGSYYYDTFDFTVSTSGLYSGTLHSAFDNVLGLYTGAFNPASPLVNALRYDDDSGPGYDAEFQYHLVAGQTYTALVTSDYQTQGGFYQLAFNGVGDVVQPGGVPEPSTWALMLLGFAGVGFVMRRRSATRQNVSVANA